MSLNKAPSPSFPSSTKSCVSILLFNFLVPDERCLAWRGVSLQGALLDLHCTLAPRHVPWQHWTIYLCTKLWAQDRCNTKILENKNIIAV